MKAILREVKEVYETMEISELVEKLKTGKWIVFRVVEKENGLNYLLKILSPFPESNMRKEVCVKW